MFYELLMVFHPRSRGGLCGHRFRVLSEGRVLSVYTTLIVQGHRALIHLWWLISCRIHRWEMDPLFKWLNTRSNAQYLTTIFLPEKRLRWNTFRGGYWICTVHTYTPTPRHTHPGAGKVWTLSLGYHKKNCSVSEEKRQKYASRYVCQLATDAVQPKKAAQAACTNLSFHNMQKSFAKTVCLCVSVCLYHWSRPGCQGRGRGRLLNCSSGLDSLSRVRIPFSDWERVARHHLIWLSLSLEYYTMLGPTKQKQECYWNSLWMRAVCVCDWPWADSKNVKSKIVLLKEAL